MTHHGRVQHVRQKQGFSVTGQWRRSIEECSCFEHIFFPSSFHRRIFSARKVAATARLFWETHYAFKGPFRGNHSIQIIDDSRNGAWSRVICNREKVSPFVLVSDCVWINVPTLQKYFVRSFVVIRTKMGTWTEGVAVAVQSLRKEEFGCPIVFQFVDDKGYSASKGRMLAVADIFGFWNSSIKLSTSGK